MTAPTLPTAPPEESVRPPRRTAAPRRPIRSAALLGGLVIALVAAVVISAGMGAFRIAPLDVAGSVLGRIGLSAGTPLDEVADAVLWEIRFPRLILTVLVGACLGAAGAIMQGSFGNPLAEPGIIGVSSGAVVGAASQIVIGFAPLGIWTLTGAAFAGGLVTVFAVYALSRSNGRTEVVTLVLTGVAVNAFAGAVIGLFTFYSTDAELRSITFWTLGSVAQATWTKVIVVGPIALAGVAMAMSLWRELDLLALGERSAWHLGVDVEGLRVRAMTVVALLTAAAVAVSGIILFIGLVIPHLVRMVAGPGHRLLLPASAVAGSLILVLADLVARTIAAPAEIPLGVLTSLLGTPVFFWQLRRTRANQGGWA